MRKTIKWLLPVLITLMAASAIAVVLMAGQRPDQDDEDQEEAVKAPSHVTQQNGRTVIRLNAPTQQREGIQVSAVKETFRRAELRATAVLLPVNDLAGLRDNYVTARAKVERGQAELKVARSRYARTQALYRQNQNMSLQAVQDAEASFRGDQAQTRADEQDAALQLDAVRRNWGTVVAAWIAANEPPLDSLLAQRSFLAQVTFPPEEVAKPPARLSLVLPADRLIAARLVSPAPRISSQIQGISFLYLLSSRPGLATGMNLAVLVPVGQRLRGAIIPQSAVVWWQGKAWAYEEVSPGTFTRFEVPTASPVSAGYFVPGAAFPSGAKLVTAGAQALLSEEFRSQIQEED